MVSQIWFLYQRRCIWPKLPWRADFRLKKASKPNDETGVGVEADIIVYTYPNETVVKYIQRREDLRNVFGSEMFSVPLAVILAILLRVAYGEVLVSPLMVCLYVAGVIVPIGLRVAEHDIRKEVSYLVTEILNESEPKAGLLFPKPKKS